MAIEAKTRVSSAAANGKNGHTLISDAKFRQLYGLALQLRLLAESSGGGSLRGREAALAGVAADLRGDDIVLEGESALLTAALGSAWPGAQRRNESHSAGDGVIEAMGAAVADRMKKNGRVSVLFLPQAVETEALKEARRIADAAKLPVLFVEDCRAADGPELKNARNGRSGVNGKGPLAEIGAMPVMPVDAQDVVAIYRVAHESIARARQGTGPTRIQCVSWQLSGRTNRRTAGNAQSADAVEHLEQWLESRGLPAQEWRQEIVAKFGKGRRNRAGGNGHATAQAK